MTKGERWRITCPYREVREAMNCTSCLSLETILVLHSFVQTKSEGSKKKKKIKFERKVQILLAFPPPHTWLITA